METTSDEAPATSASAGNGPEIGPDSDVHKQDVERTKPESNQGVESANQHSVRAGETSGTVSVQKHDHRRSVDDAGLDSEAPASKRKRAEEGAVPKSEEVESTTVPPVEYSAPPAGSETSPGPPDPSGESAPADESLLPKAPDSTGAAMSVPLEAKQEGGDWRHEDKDGSGDRNENSGGDIMNNHLANNFSTSPNVGSKQIGTESSIAPHVGGDQEAHPTSGSGIAEAPSNGSGVELKGPVDVERGPLASDADEGGTQVGPNGSASSGLPPKVFDAVERLFSDSICEREDIDNRALDFLATLPEHVALTAVEDISHRDFSTIRNRPAFVMSIFKRVVNPPREMHPSSSGPGPYGSSGYGAGRGPIGGGPRGPLPPQRGNGMGGPPSRVLMGPPGPSGPRAGMAGVAGGMDMYAVPKPHQLQPQQVVTVDPAALSHLPPMVADGLQRVFAAGVCHPSQFDDRAMEILINLKEVEAIRALNEFASVEPGRVRNPSAFWMGLARKYKALGDAGGPGTSDAVPGRRKPDDGYNSYGGGGGGSGSGGVVHGGGSGGNNGFEALIGDFRFPTVRERIQALISDQVLAPGDLDLRAVEALNRLNEQDALSVLEEVLWAGPNRVRNVSAYIMGLCRKRGGPASGGSFGGIVGDADADHRDMDPGVRAKFEELISTGVLPQHGLDARAMFALKSMHPKEAIESLDELARSEPGRVRNLSAYFMGLARSRSRH
eukprot:CAMPEP_0185850326 /NCGR_PEP_ID=MMETSP1354-20130828/4503_1 /TAXON_ID=708628 /ORGANISM="Erythrolobus madagascarensis, Strain CCMP3276" /LENGTH=722 /DNA_ID=CAMNT_0028550993 /DNA_START=429 /DNA_END=2597 /DNA_ORIENTATION=+